MNRAGTAPVRQRTAILAAAIPLCRPVLHNGSLNVAALSFLATSIAAFPAVRPGALADPVIDIAERHVRQQPGDSRKVTIIMGGLAPGPSLPPAGCAGSLRRLAHGRWKDASRGPLSGTQILERAHPGPCPRDRKLCQRRAASDRRKVIAS